MPEDAGKKEAPSKKGGKLGKYKWYIVGGLAVVAVLVFYFVNKSNQSQQGSSTGQGMSGIDPNTGLPYASEYGAFPSSGGGGGMFGGIGPAGPKGPPGPRGPRGPRNRDRDTKHRPREGHTPMTGGHTPPHKRTARSGARLNAFNNQVLTHPGTMR